MISMFFFVTSLIDKMDIVFSWYEQIKIKVTADLAHQRPMCSLLIPLLMIEKKELKHCYQFATSIF